MCVFWGRVLDKMHAGEGERETARVPNPHGLTRRHRYRHPNTSPQRVLMQDDSQVARAQHVEELLQVLPRAHHHGRLPPRVEGALLYLGGRTGTDR